MKARSEADALEIAIRALWSQLFEVLMRLAALERAVKDAKSEIASNPNDFTELYGLKSERDALRRDLGAGTIWVDVASNSDGASLH